MSESYATHLERAFARGRADWRYHLVRAWMVRHCIEDSLGHSPGGIPGVDLKADAVADLVLEVERRTRARVLRDVKP